MIEKRIFGILPDGREVTLYTISNRWKEYVELLDFGAAIHGIYVKDNKDKIDNVVLNAGSATELLGRSYEGVTIGRCANRIAYGRYYADGNEVQLQTNSGQHFLHGADGNYAFKMFQAEMEERNNSIRFTRTDLGEGGYGCNVKVSVCFTFGDDHKLMIDYEMIPDGTTVLCPTNHAYFNLCGEDVREHYMQIFADNMACKGATGMPEGDIACVEGTPLDYRRMSQILEHMESDTSGFFTKEPKRYDDCFILDKQGFGRAAELYSSQSGRRMSVYTDMPALVVFTPPPMSDHSSSGKYLAICLETQYVPNAVNCPQFQSCIFRVGETLKSRTIYEFSTVG